MKQKFVYFGIFSILASLIIISTFSTIQSSNTDYSYISGDNCLRAHYGIYINQTAILTYTDSVSPNSGLNYSINYARSIEGMVFSVVSEINYENSSIYLLSGEVIQEKKEMTKEEFKPSWQITANEEGNYTFFIESTIKVRFLNFHSNYDAIYLFTYQGILQIKNNSNSSPPSPIIESLSLDSLVYTPGVTKVPIIDFPKLLGQIFGFISILAIYFVICLGMPIRRREIQKKFHLKAARIQEWHNNVGYFATAVLSMHLFFISQSKAWGNYVKWFEFYPQFLGVFENFDRMFVGLDIAAWSGIFFLITTITGAFFKKITRIWNYRFALLFQQLSYISLLLAGVHAMLNGSWTRDYPIIAGILAILIFDIIKSRIKIFLNRKQKRILKKELEIESIIKTNNTEKFE